MTAFVGRPVCPDFCTFLYLNKTVTGPLSQHIHVYSPVVQLHNSMVDTLVLFAIRTVTSNPSIDICHKIGMMVRIQNSRYAFG
jgi:hypothetical protein